MHMLVLYKSVYVLIVEIERTFNIQRDCGTDGASLVGGSDLVHSGVFLISLGDDQLVVTSLELLDLDLLSIRMDLLSSSEPFNHRLGLSCDLADKGGIALELDAHVPQFLLEGWSTDLDCCGWNNGSGLFTVVTLSSQVFTLHAEDVLDTLGQMLDREHCLFDLVCGHQSPFSPFLPVLLVLFLKTVALDLGATIAEWRLPGNNTGVFGDSRHDWQQRW